MTHSLSSKRPSLLFLLLFLFSATAGCALMDALQEPPQEEEIGDGDQEPGDGDQEPGDGDQEPGDGDQEPTPECTEGEERICDCDLPDGFDGLQTCTEDEVFGECICPEICNEPLLGPVLVGESCGICRAGLYQCDEDGVASCTEPSSINACGGCEPTPDVLCTGGSFAVCNATEQIECVAVSSTEIDLDQPLDFDRHQVFYLYLNDPDASCENWEIGAAGVLPGAYRQASVENGKISALLPGDSSNGILRVVIRQNVAPDEEPEKILSTHFACGSPDDTLPIRFHPAPFRGDSLMAYLPVLSGVPSNEIDGLGKGHPNHWVINALKNFGNNPGSIFTGCQDGCGGYSFSSIFENFELRRNSSHWQVSAFSGWNNFYTLWSALLDDDDFRETLQNAYQSIFDDYLENQIYGHLDHYDSWRQTRLYDEENHFTSEVFRDFRLQHTAFWPTALLGEAPKVENSALGIRSAPLNDCSPNYGFGTPSYCPFITPLVSMELSGAPAPLTYSLDLKEPFYQIPNETPPFGKLLRFHLEHYFPKELFPRPEFDEFDDPTFGGYENLEAFFLEVAPCELLNQRLHEFGALPEQIGEFASLCDQLFSPLSDDADETFFARFMDRFPFQRPDRLTYFLEESTNNCPPDIVEDPYHGLRITRFRTSTIICGPFDSQYVSEDSDLPSPGSGVIQAPFLPISLRMLNPE